jgi:arabinose-5-phosphate isomerase
MDVSAFLATLTASLGRLDDPALRAQLGEAGTLVARADHVWCTGFGKSARAASLLAEDLATLTLSASFVHGGDLLHGGMGRIEARHCLVLFSDGGKTGDLIRASRAVRATRVLITASETPGIEADHVVRYPPQPDGPYPLPGATVAQVVIGRLLAFAAAESAEIAPAGLGWAHPA